MRFVVERRLPWSRSLRKTAASATCKRLFSARSRNSSICSAVTAFAPGPFSLPASKAFSQLRRVCVDLFFEVMNVPSPASLLPESYAKTYAELR